MDLQEFVALPRAEAGLMLSCMPKSEVKACRKAYVARHGWLKDPNYGRRMLDVAFFFICAGLGSLPWIWRHPPSD